MATAAFTPTLTRRISLAQIDTAVFARLGPSRIPGNAQPACFNRQIAMYLARHVGHWSAIVIGRFYNGRDHSTVCHGIHRIEWLREADPEVDALLGDLKNRILEGDAGGEPELQDDPVRASYSGARVERLSDLISERVCAYLETHLRRADSKLE